MSPDSSGGREDRVRHNVGIGGRIRRRGHGDREPIIVRSPARFDCTSTKDNRTAMPGPGPRAPGDVLRTTRRPDECIVVLAPRLETDFHPAAPAHAPPRRCLVEERPVHLTVTIMPRLLGDGRTRRDADAPTLLPVTQHQAPVLYLPMTRRLVVRKAPVARRRERLLPIEVVAVTQRVD